jgi:hypothetical protein
VGCARRGGAHRRRRWWPEPEEQWVAPPEILAMAGRKKDLGRALVPACRRDAEGRTYIGPAGVTGHRVNFRLTVNM